MIGMKVRAGLLAAALVGASVVAAASPAGAASKPINEGGDTRPCVTYEEFYAVGLGAPMRRVRRTFDTNGHRVDGGVLSSTVGDVSNNASSPARRQVRAYPVCLDGGLVSGYAYMEFNMRTARDRVTAGMIDAH